MAATVLALTLEGDDPATARYYEGVARTLSREFRLLLGTVKPAGNVQARAAVHGHEVFSLDCMSRRDYPRAVRKLATLIRRERVDIVHGNEEFASCLSGSAGLLAGRGIRIYHRQHEFSSSLMSHAAPAASRVEELGRRLASWRYGQADRLAGRLAQSIITLGEAHRASVLRERPHWASKTVGLWHGVPGPADLAELRQRAGALREELGFAGRFVLTLVARLNWRKGHRVLLEAMRSEPLRALRPAAVIVGYGPLDEDLKREAQETGLGGDIHFAGKQADVFPYLAAADVAVMPSLTEPFGLVAAEAMACGVPLVASATGGLTEIVLEATTGNLVTPGNPVELCHALAKLGYDRELRERLGAAARARYTEYFSQEAMTSRWEGHYRALLAARGAERPASHL